MTKQPNCFQRLWQDRYGKNVQPDVRLFLDNMLACSVVAGLLVLCHQYENWFYYRRFMRKPLTEVQLYKLNMEAAGVKNWNQTFQLHPFQANTSLNSMAASHSRMATIQTTIWILRILYYFSFVYIAWFVYRYIGPLCKLGGWFIWICVFQYAIKYLLWEIQQLIKKALSNLNPVNIVKKIISVFKKKKPAPPQDNDYTQFDENPKSGAPNWYRDFYSKWWNNHVMRWWNGELEKYRRKSVGSPLFRLIKTAVYYIILPFNLASKTLMTAKTVGVDAPYREFKSSLGQLYPKLIEKPGEAWYESAISNDWTMQEKLEQQQGAAMFSTSFAHSKWTKLKRFGFYILMFVLFVAAVVFVVIFRRKNRTTFDMPTFLKHMKAMFNGIKA